MQRWSGNFDIRSRDPLPTVLVILGFIATFIIGLPLQYFDKPMGIWVIIIGVVLIFIGIGLWIAERS